MIPAGRQCGLGTNRRRWTGSGRQADAEQAAWGPVALLYRVIRWLGSGRGQPDAPSGKYGCLNPLFLLKAIVLIAVVVFLPLFFLPYMLVWTIAHGRTALGYASVMTVRSGETAKWGHGVLAAPASTQAIRAGVAAIAAHDRGFRPEALTAWASAAVEAICHSITAGDAAPVRTFMSNGLFRAHLALLELRARSAVTCTGSWRAVQVQLLEARRSPLVDQVRVRVTCQGSCQERHAVTGLVLRGGNGPATWCEDLVFGRSARAMTPAAGGLPARRCPSCGAPLELTPDGGCSYCRAVVTAGSLDWVLVSWQREPW